MDTAEPRYIRWFAELGVGDVAIAGGKNASLGEMVRELGARGVNVPNGFAVTADAYRAELVKFGMPEGEIGFYMSMAHSIKAHEFSQTDDVLEQLLQRPRLTIREFIRAI